MALKRTTCSTRALPLEFVRLPPAALLCSPPHDSSLPPAAAAAPSTSTVTTHTPWLHRSHLRCGVCIVDAVSAAGVLAFITVHTIDAWSRGTVPEANHAGGRGLRLWTLGVFYNRTVVMVSIVLPMFKNQNTKCPTTNSTSSDSVLVVDAPLPGGNL